MIQSLKSKASTSAERIIIVDPSNGTATVGAGEATVASYCPIGISIDSCSTNGSVPFKTAGEIARLVFNDTITAGAFFTSDSNGKGIPFTGAVTNTTYIAGIALETVVSTGSVINVYFQPMANNLV